MKTIQILILVALLLYNSGAVMATENIPSEDKNNVESSEVSVQVFYGDPGESTLHHAIRILKVEMLNEHEPVRVLGLT